MVVNWDEISNFDRLEDQGWILGGVKLSQEGSTMSEEEDHNHPCSMIATMEAEAEAEMPTSDPIAASVTENEEEEKEEERGKEENRKEEEKGKETKL